ncbi:unnamed protein product [Urochloa humidicola]
MCSKYLAARENAAASTLDVAPLRTQKLAAPAGTLGGRRGLLVSWCEVPFEGGEEVSDMGQRLACPPVL